jgi:hypothetical protein
MQQFTQHIGQSNVWDPEKWTWLITTLKNRLRLDITDSEELLMMKGNREEETGLWFTMAAPLYAIFF